MEDETRVFALYANVHYEGSDILGIFATYDKAYTEALKLFSGLTSWEVFQEANITSWASNDGFDVVIQSFKVN